jgi:hypothetical protein
MKQFFKFVCSLLTKSSRQENVTNKEDITSQNYETIAACKTSVLRMVKTNPDVLFKVVQTKSCCHNKCCNCDDDDDNHDVNDDEVDSFHKLRFIDVVTRHKTLSDKDLLVIDKHFAKSNKNTTQPRLDWFKISRCMTLSYEVLKEVAMFVDWNHVSRTLFTHQNVAIDTLIAEFHTYIVWENVSTFAKPYESVKLVFEDKIIPLKHAIHLYYLSENDIVKHESDCLEYLGDIMFYYGVHVVCRFTNTNVVNKFLLKHANDFVRSCERCEFIPCGVYFSTLVEALKQCSDVEISSLFKKCKFDEVILREKVMPYVPSLSHVMIDCISKTPNLSDEFISDYHDILNWKYVFANGRQYDESVILKYLNDATAESVSKHQQLTPEFIDKHSERLDWFELCEHQKLPEWLLKKHIGKVNWGQVSLYQELSPSFIREYWSALNPLKLKQNLYITKKHT